MSTIQGACELNDACPKHSPSSRCLRRFGACGSQSCNQCYAASNWRVVQFNP